jgi:hypothetical protein
VATADIRDSRSPLKLLGNADQRRDRLVDTLAERNLLVPDACENWPLWPDIYISWVAQLVGGYQVTWGHMDDPRPPIYGNHRNHMKFAPSPLILRRDFLVYHPIRYVTMNDEQTLRDHYAERRRAGRD